jgi:hypothetical protein
MSYKSKRGRNLGRGQGWCREALLARMHAGVADAAQLAGPVNVRDGLLALGVKRDGEISILRSVSCILIA